MERTDIYLDLIIANPMLLAPIVFSGVPSQRRVVGECPTPTAATFPLCSQTPKPSVARYMEAGAFSVGIANSYMRALKIQLIKNLVKASL